MIQVNIEEIRIIVEKSIRKIEQTKGAVFYLEEDLYWSVPEEKLTDMSGVPDLNVGSIKMMLIF